MATVVERTLVRRIPICVLVIALVMGLATPVGATSGWSIVKSANNPTNFNFLYDVSCVSSTRCVAVGVGLNAIGNADVTLTEVRNGGAWTVVPSPNPGGTWNFLTGVSCISSTSCMAVGRYETPNGTNQTLAEYWNGKRWAFTPPVNLGTFNNALSGVSCVSLTSCVAVGSWTSVSSGITQPLVEQWNGKHWSVASTPNTPKTRVAGLNNVSCRTVASTGDTACLAVGSSMNLHEKVQHTFVEHLGLRGWSILTSPNLGTSDNVFSDVSCITYGECFLVGNYTPADQPGITRTLTAKWDGTWRLAEAPSPGTALSVLSGVSCVATTCEAVGWYQDKGSDRRKPLVERLSKSVWKAISTPNPPAGTKQDNYLGGITGAGLYGVSCPSISSCHTAGFQDDSKGHDQTLITRLG